MAWKNARGGTFKGSKTAENEALSAVSLYDRTIFSDVPDLFDGICPVVRGGDCGGSDVVERCVAIIVRVKKLTRDPIPSYTSC